jgi:beta-glucanase (GH16 family)
MKGMLACILALILFAVLAKSATMQVPCPCAVINLDKTFQLKFDDEFNGSSLDQKNWNTQFPWGRVSTPNGEAQYYAPDSFKVADGLLQIQADKRDMEGFHYTSGIITTFDKFSMTFGYVEMRAKLPKGKGLWPAFWLIPVDQSWPPEMDVFEARGDHPDTISMTNHWSDEGKHQFVTQSYTGPDFTQDFHTFGVEWSPSEIIWYVDGVDRFRTNQGVPSKPMYLVVNLAVGGNLVGYPDDSTPFPSHLEIDYVRAYAQVSSGTTTPTK